jgi:hypothetical protein
MPKTDIFPTVSRKTTTSLKFIKYYKNLFLNTNDKQFTQVPKAINKLTTKLNQNSTLNELDFNKNVNIEPKNKSQAQFDGYLNIFVHYAYIDKKHLSNKNEEQEFYSILRLDQQPHACTAIGFQTTDTKKPTFFKLEFNEQFILNLTSNKIFDLIICSQVKKKNCSNWIENDDDDDLVKVEDLFFSSQFDFNFLFSTQFNCKLCVYLKHFLNEIPSSSIPLTSISSSNSCDYKNDAYFYVTINYLKEFSLINQIFSNKLNSKLITSAQLDDENCKFYLVLRKLIYEIETRGGLYEPYLYQLNVCLSDVKWMLLQLERDCLDIIQNMPDIHVISSKYFERRVEGN